MSAYLLDSNLFRYMHNDDNAAYQKAAKEFFTTARKEVLDGQSIILLSAEVKCELEVQMHTLKDRSKRIICDMLEGYLPVSANLSVDLEHELRKFSNYIRSNKFNSIFKNPHYKIDYLRASDARILVDAYLNDAILVTANIKDFITYSVFCETGEQKLYDFLNKRYVEISSAARTAIEVDPFYLSIQSKLEALQP
ncbi:DUF4411 family protein [Paenibacillus donghaensis]|uniref:PIN domain-containing protein n=1 Tax=Paenibacillus donghaensis TaxID=414771 RepID=A0A2Z2KQ30_9BACL|nr:DUF4411 family protein [Paenibacillus donghaensis]ASA24799.1 hypothetical protein B9T62_30995 [Paenibacillus donghaensis]